MSPLPTISCFRRHFRNILHSIMLHNQAWKKCLFPCKLGKISLQQGRFPSSVGRFPSCILFFPLQIPHLGTTFSPLFLKVLLKDNFKTFFEGLFFLEGRMYGSNQDLGVPAANYWVKRVYHLNVYIIIIKQSIENIMFRFIV